MKFSRCKLACSLRAFAAAMAALWLTGCGESNPFTTLPVSGKVTYEDGSPIDAATVIVHFIPDQKPVGSKHPQPAQAKLAADGTFAEASTFGKSDGAIPGRHKIVIEASNSDYSPRASAVAGQFCDPTQTPLFVDVQADTPNHFVLTVKRGP